MTDLYIEQASSAFRQLWSSNGQMTVSIPSLGDSIQLLQRRARDTDEALHQVAVRVDAQQRLLESTRADMSSLQSAVQGLSRRLDGLLEGRDGFVTRSALQNEVYSLPAMHDLRRLKEDMDVQTKRLDECIADMEMRAASVQRVVSENITRTMSDEVRGLQQAHQHLAQETQVSVQRLTASVNRFPALLQDVRNESASQLQSSVQQLTQTVQQLRNDSQSELEATNGEVLSHLKRQAQVIDALSDEVHAKSSDLPRVADLTAVREEMKVTREDMDKAQFRIQEAFSQIMSLTRQAAEIQSNRATSIAATPRQQQQAPARPTATAASLFDLTGLQDLSQIGGATPVAPGLDPLLTSGLQRLLTSTVPTLVAALAEQRESSAKIVQMNQRSADLLKNLLTCVGLSQEELMGSLAVLDRGHVLQLLRRALDVLQGGSTASVPPVMQPSAQPLSSSSYYRDPRVTPSLTARAARPPPAEVPTGPELGVDVADALRGDGARIMSVVQGSYADAAGLQAGDVITVVDDVPIANSEVFANCVRSALQSMRGSLKLAVVNGNTQRRQTIFVKLSPQ